ncbi:acyl-CoA thioesterase [Oceanobacter kriegii]|uniref:acyl-CoA thioesterase n=1 Tax=Oceanobacter kriegii TaxID=64972 RepID=UPI00041FC905|nr:acyl-CoA thioesterase II [Oceanobacter kriegii]
MSDVLNELTGLLNLSPLGDNRFQGECRDLGFRSLFGGQVLGQSLSAAMQTLTDLDANVDFNADANSKATTNASEHGWWPHSLHAYFLQPGNTRDPLSFEVTRTRDGRSFANRQVLVYQNGNAVMSFMCSFHRHERGFEHQDIMPQSKGPEGVASQLELARQWRDCFPERLQHIYTADQPIEMRVVDPVNIFQPDVREPTKHAWMKAIAPLSDDARVHATLLAYASDFNLITTSLQPHGVSVYQREMQVASLDHSIWFHRPFRMDEWLLYSIDSPNASGGRGFCRGQIFNQHGLLVASVAQEGLIRQRDR